MDTANLLFAGLVALVVCVVFLIAFKGADLLDGATPGNTPVASSNTADALHQAFSDEASRAYFAALSVADPRSYSELERRIARQSGAPTDDLRMSVIEHSESFFRRNAGVLARADVRHVDAMILNARAGLRQAIRANSRFCRGSTYAALSEMSEQEVRRMLEGVIDYGWNIGFQTLLAEAVMDAKQNPVDHGEMTRRDETALQGVMMSLMADPQIMPLIMSSNGNASPEEILARLDICELGDSVLVAVKTLPQETKARAWAMMMKEGGRSNPFSSVQGFPGF